MKVRVFTVLLPVFLSRLALPLYLFRWNGCRYIGDGRTPRSRTFLGPPGDIRARVSRGSSGYREGARGSGPR